MKRALLFLQNAWSESYAGREWPRESWLRALARSRSGKRLSVMIDDFDICVNTTPIVGSSPDSVEAPDEDYIIRKLFAAKPEIVIACGRQAEAALVELWDGPLLAVPHPAHRLVTDKLYRRARRLLANGFEKRLALRQLRGEVRVVALPKSKGGFYVV